MFINTKGKNRDEFSREFVELMDYINASVGELEQYTTTDRVKQLHEGIQRLKRSKEVNDKYMFLWEEIEEYKDEARGIARQIVIMGLEFGFSMADILARLQKQLSVSLSEAEEYFKMYSGQEVYES